MPGSDPVELRTFLGEWRDSMGNNVRVDWARAGSRGGQLSVELSKPRSSRDPIRLDVKSMGRDRFTCGHYDLDTERSHSERIVWLDCRNHGKVSIWERQGPTSQGEQRRSNRDHLDAPLGRDFRDDRNGCKGSKGQDEKDGRDDHIFHHGRNLQDSCESREGHGSKDARDPTAPVQQDPSRPHVEGWNGSRFGWDGSGHLRPTWQEMWSSHPGMVQGNFSWHAAAAPGAWQPQVGRSVTPGAWVPPVQASSPAGHDGRHASLAEGGTARDEESANTLSSGHTAHPLAPPVPHSHRSGAPPDPVPELADYDRSLLRAASSEGDPVEPCIYEGPARPQADSPGSAIATVSMGQRTKEQPTEPRSSELENGRLPEVDTSPVTVPVSVAKSPRRRPEISRSCLQELQQQKPLEASIDNSSEAAIYLPQVAPEFPGDSSQGLPGRPSRQPLEVPLDESLEVMAGRVSDARVADGATLQHIPLSQGSLQDPRRHAPQSGVPRGARSTAHDPRTRPAEAARGALSTEPSGLAPASAPSLSTGPELQTVAIPLGMEPSTDVPANPPARSTGSRTSAEVSGERRKAACPGAPSPFEQPTPASPAQSGVPGANQRSTSSMVPSVSLGSTPLDCQHATPAAPAPVVTSNPATAHSGIPSSSPLAGLVPSPCGSAALPAAASPASVMVMPPMPAGGTRQKDVAPLLAASPPWGQAVGQTSGVSSVEVSLATATTPHWQSSAVPAVSSWPSHGLLPADRAQHSAHGQAPASALRCSPSAPPGLSPLASTGYVEFPKGSRPKAKPPDKIPVQPPVEAHWASGAWQAAVPTTAQQQQQRAPRQAVEAESTANQREAEDSQRRLAAYSALLLGGAEHPFEEEEEAPWRLRKRRRVGGLTIASSDD